MGNLVLLLATTFELPLEAADIAKRAGNVNFDGMTVAQTPFRVRLYASPFEPISSLVKHDI